MKFNDPKFKNEIFVRIDIKHSYFSNYFIIYLQSIFSVVETVCCLPKINSCLCIIFVFVINFKVTNLTLYMYLFTEIS